ncbi:MAG TPA: TIGR04053 family radical SAM/SPASM domain-containing protein [Bryobacteraceae bacterium]|jgi:radical SAM protein|nr:TIGR04053 family radical SAM/SPASM domain-containing protein [Bryobacteraceae bacterium]
MKNFDEAPFLVIWELTQACDLACVHCRACAIESRNPFELKTEEGFRLLEEVRSFGDPLMVFTGGDPLKRPDLFQLLEKSVSLGLRTTVTPSATPLLTETAIERFKACGVARMAISLDGPDATSHDGFRRVEGSFDRTLLALNHAKRIGLQTQINTTVTRHNVHRLAEIARVVEQSGAKLWSVFFLVATGRASVSQDLTPEEYEEVFGFLYDLSKTVPFDIKTTEAQHYRRYVAQRKKAEGGNASGPRPAAPDVIQRQAGINDGKGFVFVSHTGEIFPSGFLPLSAGNVRRDSLASVYRTSPLFQTLRDADNLHGKCGECEYRNLCGGSRSRSYALTGDFLAEEARCVYQPAPTSGKRRRPATPAILLHVENAPLVHIGGV